MTAYYNEHDKHAAAWLRELIHAGLIASGDVDERSIEDVLPTELAGYTQCHFFAGIGGWSYAMRLAGWPDDRPVWTGSCPCQPFSAAGKGGGFDDERHLWPAFFHLIQHGKPRTVPVFGEQVASKDGLAWLDLVSADLEGAGYAVGAVDLCAAGVGAPHIRQRLWFVAESNSESCGQGREISGRWNQGSDAESWTGLGGSGLSVELADSNGRQPRNGNLQPGWKYGLLAQGGGVDELVNPIKPRLEGLAGHGDGSRQPGRISEDAGRSAAAPGAVNGFWNPADWLPCRDGKARPVEPLPFAVVDGVSESLGRVCDQIAAATEKEITDHAEKTGYDTRKAMHDLWLSLTAEAMEQRHLGRQGGVFQAPILLAFLRQLADQGWSVAQSLPCSSAEVQKEKVRSLRIGLPSSCSPYQRGLAGQQAGEYPNSLRILSSILARHAQTAWGETFNTYAKDHFVLGHGLPARVGRLRGYGNAIVPEAAAEVIRAYLQLPKF